MIDQSQYIYTHLRRSGPHKTLKDCRNTPCYSWRQQWGHHHYQWLFHKLQDMMSFCSRKKVTNPYITYSIDCLRRREGKKKFRLEFVETGLNSMSNVRSIFGTSERKASSKTSSCATLNRVWVGIDTIRESTAVDVVTGGRSQIT